MKAYGEDWLIPTRMGRGYTGPRLKSQMAATETRHRTISALRAGLCCNFFTQQVYRPSPVSTLGWRRGGAGLPARLGLELVGWRFHVFQAQINLRLAARMRRMREGGQQRVAARHGP